MLRRSIVELCEADHGNDPAVLGRWLSNKTVEEIRSWLVRPDGSLLLAVHDYAIAAVGSVTDAGLITLNYVLPDFRFRGASRALLSALEAGALERGAERFTPASTETAHRFYWSAGYSDAGAPERLFGASGGYPMQKTLRP